MSHEWRLAQARPLPAEQGWDALRVVAFELRFPPDAPPGGQITVQRLRGGKASGPPETLALAADEMPGVEDLAHRIGEWAGTLLAKHGLLEGTKLAAPPAPPTVRPEPALGTLR